MSTNPKAVADDKAKKLIMVVEDDGLLKHAVELALLSRGYGVMLAGSVSEALQSLRASNPSLVILDTAMQDGKGWAVADRIRSRHRSCPIVIASANRIRRSELIEHGVFRHLTKPYDIAELLIAVEAAMNSAHIER